MVHYGDSISKLDDDLLLRIIDLLPTEDALRTSVLSWRWKHLLKSISNIDVSNFIFKSSHQKFSFMVSIDRLLVDHDTCDIKRFYFPCHSSVADRWISEVINHNVEELHIASGLWSNSLVTLPLCLFKSEFLTVFEIDIFEREISSKSAFFDRVIDISRYPDTVNLVSDSSLFSVHLPSLKRLQLSRVVFFDNHTTQHFFSNIPNLQQLCLYKCDWQNVNRLIIDIPTLETIDVAIRDTYVHKCQVTVIAPNLTSLKCDTDFSIDFLVSNHSMSLNVLLKTCFFQGIVADRPLPLRFLDSVKQAMSLHMGWDVSMDTWLRNEGIVVEDLPFFINLKHFEICADKYNVGCDVDLERIFMFLHKMTNLESFTITVPDRNKQKGNADLSNDVVPGCIINQIKEVNVITSLSPYCLHDNRVDSTAMDLIKYFMDNSQSLETLEINLLCHSSIPTRVFLDEIERHNRYSELKRFSYSHNYIIPKLLQSMHFPWER